jgi:hypothetical protein
MHFVREFKSKLRGSKGAAFVRVTAPGLLDDSDEASTNYCLTQAQNSLSAAIFIVVVSKGW